MIQKFVLDLQNPNYLPYGDVLLLSEQNGLLTIWILAENNYNKRLVYIFPTGCVPMSWHSHIGSAVVGDFVWHVFEGK